MALGVPILKHFRVIHQDAIHACKNQYWRCCILQGGIMLQQVQAKNLMFYSRKRMYIVVQILTFLKYTQDSNCEKSYTRVSQYS